MPACTGCWRLLEQEVMVAMALAGARSLAELNRSFLHFGAPPVTAPHVHSAFPLLFRTPESYRSPCHCEFHTGFSADPPWMKPRSCPIVMAGEGRPSTSCEARRKKDVDGGAKPRHDDGQ